MKATLTAAYINPPKRPGLSSSIKDTTGAYWGFREKELSFEKGKTYTVEYTESESGDKTYKNITKIVGTEAQAGDRWWLPFASNQVAHAIAAGLIKEPAEIKLWAAAAREAIIEVDEAAKTAEDNTFPDDIPY